MTKDLTSLLAYLRVSQSSKTKHSKDSLEDNDPSQHSSVLALKSSTTYQIKTLILQIFATLSRDRETLKIIPNPVNLMFSELLVNHKESVFAYDPSFRLHIYEVLDNFADLVESRHKDGECCKLPDSTPEMMMLYRKKLDKLIWRAHNRLAPAVEVKDYADIDVQLKLLAEYVKYCPSNVVSQQLADVCMETLLKIKDHLISMWHSDRRSTQFITTAHYMLQVLDQVIIHNKHGPFNSFLSHLLFDQPEFLRFTKHCIGQALLSKNFEREIAGFPKSSLGQEKLSQTRAGLVNHFTVSFLC